MRLLLFKLYLTTKICALILTHPKAYLIFLSSIPIKYYQPNNNLY